MMNKCTLRYLLVKTLGLRWDTDSDEFCFYLTEIVELARALPTTKRTLLKLTAKIFEPLEILSVFSVDMKIMFQELCLRGGVQWDEELHGEDRLGFNLFLSKLKQVSCHPRRPGGFFQGC